MFDSLRPHELQHTRLSCPSLSPWVCSVSCPLSQWCHPTISPTVVPFFSCFQSVPASGFFPVNRLFASGGHSIEASASASALLIQGWFPLGLTGFISLLSKGLARVFSTPQFENINSLMPSLLYGPTVTSICDYWKNHSFDYTDLVNKVMSLLFNTLFRFAIESRH